MPQRTCQCLNVTSVHRHFISRSFGPLQVKNCTNFADSNKVATHKVPTYKVPCEDSDQTIIIIHTLCMLCSEVERSLFIDGYIFCFWGLLSNRHQI